MLAALCLMPAAIVAAGGDPASLQEQDPPPGFRIDRDNWETPVEPGRSIHIENPHGDVRARLNEIPRLDVFAVIQLQDHDPLRADVQIIETPEGVKVDVRYVAKETGGQEGERGATSAEAGRQAEIAGGQAQEAEEHESEDDFIRRVDLVVYVPAGSALNVRTADGTIEARRIKSDVVAETTGGEVTVITEGSARAKTTSGSILAVLLNDNRNRSSRFETETGPITLQVPDDLNVLIRARTSGQITSEYPLEASPPAGVSPEDTVVLVGAGTHDVRLESKDGKVEILAWKRDRSDGESQ